jgi:WhiB family redox-sensing transcriptional regulator
MSDLEDLSWQDEALCREVDSSIFYVDKGESTAPAKATCNRCDVTDQCLKYALDNDERFGVWGGKSERERRRIQNGVTGKTHTQEITERNVEIVAAWMAGASPTEVADMFDLGVSTVRAILADRTNDTPDGPTWRGHTEDTVRGWHERQQAGESYAQIGSTTGIDGTSIGKAVREWLKATNQADPTQRLNPLSERQKAILDLKTSGVRSCDIARSLNVSPDIVKQTVRGLIRRGFIAHQAGEAA